MRRNKRITFIPYKGQLKIESNNTFVKMQFNKQLNITGILIKSGINYLLILLHFVSFGQNSTYLGIEIGPKFEVYQSTDNGNGLYTKPFFYSPLAPIKSELIFDLIFINIPLSLFF